MVPLISVLAVGFATCLISCDTVAAATTVTTTTKMVSKHFERSTYLPSL